MLFSFASSAANEKEPNDGSNTATIISTDALHQGKLSSGKDIDWYKFTNKKDYFKLAFSIDSSVDYDDIGSYGWKLTIYTSDGKNIIKSYENITSDFTTPVLTFKLLIILQIAIKTVFQIITQS